MSHSTPLILYIFLMFVHFYLFKIIQILLKKYNMQTVTVYTRLVRSTVFYPYIYSI